MSDPLSTRIVRKLRRKILKEEQPTKRYKRNRKLLVYRGEVRSGPVFVSFHGGGWVGGTPESISAWGKSFERMAHTSYIVEYGTYENSGATFDAGLQDAVDAGTYIAKRHRNKKLIFVGHSAGAPLAFWSCLAHQSQLAGLILFSPVTDTGPDGFKNNQIAKESRKDASPIHNIDKLTIGEDSPFLLAFHGGKDEVVPIAQTERFVDAWKERGSRNAQLIRYPALQHGFQNQHAPRIKVQTDVEAALNELGMYQRPAFLGEA